MATNESIGHFKIHNVGFYNVAARPIKCISFNEETLKLAVSRDDASIEIWNMQHAAFMEKCILGQPASSVEGLGWLDNRLFSTGLTEGLIEWNLKELKPKQKVSITGSAAWCMDIDKRNGCIAVGTYEGYINTFWVDGDDLNFSKHFDKQEGAIRCCKYNSDGRYIVTGSSDTIRIWDVAKGHAMYRMDTGRLEKNVETTVYSLVVLKDLTIIAGDSRGCMTVWNGSNGTRIDSIDALTGDVLAVAVNDEETQLCCSGVDQKIRIYVQIPRSKDSQRKWIPNLKRAVHSHDVQALTFISENQIVSAGVDGFINVSRSVKEPNSNKSNKYGPFLPQPCAVVAVSARLLLLKYFNHLEVWRLGRPNDKIQLSDEGDGQKKFLKLDENVEELVELRSTSGQPIMCASISPNGMFLIYSTESTVKLYQLDTLKKKASLTKVKVDSDKFTAPIAKVLFSSDSKSMYCVKSNGNIEIFSLCYNDEVDIKATISTKEVIKDAISLVSLSKCERYLVCAGACGTLAIWKNTNNRWSYFKTLTGQNYAPTAMAIHNKSSRIVLAYSDYQIYERDLENDSVVCTAAADFLLTGTTYTAINNILLDDNNENVVILHNDASLFVLEKGQGKGSESTSEKRVRPEPTNDARSQYYKLKKKNLGNYEHFVHLSWLSASEMVAISVNDVTLIESLPGPMYRKQFGNS